MINIKLYNDIFFKWNLSLNKINKFFNKFLDFFDALNLKINKKNIKNIFFFDKGFLTDLNKKNFDNLNLNYNIKLFFKSFKFNILLKTKFFFLKFQKIFPFFLARRLSKKIKKWRKIKRLRKKKFLKIIFYKRKKLFLKKWKKLYKYNFFKLIINEKLKNFNYLNKFRKINLKKKLRLKKSFSRFDFNKLKKNKKSKKKIYKTKFFFNRFTISKIFQKYFRLKSKKINFFKKLAPKRFFHNLFVFSKYQKVNRY